MTRALRLSLALNLVALLFACAGGTVYRYYTPQLDETCYTKGQILGKLGKDGWPDLPMTDCQAAPGKAKCVIQKIPDFVSKDTELLLCRQQLQDCQKGLPPS